MANYTYDNKILENKYTSILTTEVNLNQFITLDNTMTEGAGDTKRIVKRSVTGSVEEVGMGSGNSGDIEVSGSYQDYVLKTTQARGVYYDEEAQKDSNVIDTILKGMSEKMLEDWNGKIVAEYGKAFKNEVVGTLNFDTFVDGLAKFGEKNADLFALVHPKSIATLRKNLSTMLSYSEAFVRTGYIGSIAGVPVYMSAQVPEGEIIIANKKAVTAFINKNTEMEQDRDANLRKNSIWARTVALIALTDEDYVCRCAAAATTPTTITTYTKNQKNVAGAATTGANVYVYVNGSLKKSGVAASNAYAITLDENLVANDIVKVVAKKDGQVSSAETKTVVA